MKRKDEIQQAAHKSLCGDKSYISSYEKGFIKDAEWANKTMIDKAYCVLRFLQRSC